MVAATAALVGIATLAHPAAAEAANGAHPALSGVSTVQPSAPHDSAAALAKTAGVQADARAERTVTTANAVIADVKGTVDVSPLVASVAALDNYRYLDTTTVEMLTTHAVNAMGQVQGAALTAQQAAAQAAADAAAQQAAAVAAEAAAQAQAAANSPDAARDTARQMAASQYGWGDAQFECLDSLWTKESGWNYQAYNPGGGATGIPQALPGSKMASFGDDWQTNAATQIAWGLDYIARGYGTPCAAWTHSQSVNWY
jgi:hypothetical protein